jgi:endonuclease VIII
LLAGVGNLYKTEMCFLLGVSPWIPLRDVDPDAVVALARRLLMANAERPEQSTTGSWRAGSSTGCTSEAGNRAAAARRG